MVIRSDCGLKVLQETGKMPIPQPDAHSTARCPFHSQMPKGNGQDACSTKMSIPARCPFHKTIQIIPLLSNANI
ncbi:MAG: hypothetical protein F6K50_43375 [Moorea sp. SIO3I7]|nr:hypothetical protein [Moorena sp. SIO3I7]